ncbi:MAG: hypothetical protein ABI457_00990 [Hyphomicrobium sp.]
MRKNALLAVLILPAVAMLAPASRAQDCQDYWTAAYKCMQGCGPCGSGPSRGPASGPPSVSPKVQLLTDLNGQFAILLGELQRYQIADIDDVYVAPAPTSFDELASRIDRVYVEAYFQKERRYWEYEQFNNLRAYLMPELREQIGLLESKLASAPERLKDAETRRDEVVAKAEAEERTAGVLSGNAVAIRGDALAKRTSAVGPILELLPADLKDQFSSVITRHEEDPAYAIEEPARPPAVAEAQPQQPAPLNMSHESNESLTGPRQRPQPVTGTIEEKLAAFDDVKKNLAYTSSLLPSHEQRRPALLEEVAELRRQQDSLKEQLSAIESPLETANALADEAEQRFLAAQIAEKVSAGNVLRLAAAAVVWEHVRDAVVTPQIETILQENGLANGVAGLEMLNRIRNSPQDFIPKVGPLKDIPRLIETAKKVVNVEENMESYALAAAEANAQVGTAESESLASQLFAGLSQEGIEIMRTASEAMNGAQGKIAQALMQRAPTQE